MPSTYRQRVYAYITSEKGLLILEHPEHPEAGLQVPGGTVEENEPPSAAVVREVAEETGLETVLIAEGLGNCEFDMRQYGHDETQLAWYFHLTCEEETEDEWYFQESHSVTTPIPFRLYWSPLPYEGVELASVHGYKLPELHSILGVGI